MIIRIQASTPFTKLGGKGHHALRASHSRDSLHPQLDHYRQQDGTETMQTAGVSYPMGKHEESSPYKGVELFNAQEQHGSPQAVSDPLNKQPTGADTHRKGTAPYAPDMTDGAKN